MFWRLCCKSGMVSKKFSTVPDIASLVIYFDPKKLPKAKLFTLLDALLANLGKRKPAATLSNSSQLAPAEGDLSPSPNRNSISLSMA